MTMSIDTSAVMPFIILKDEGKKKEKNTNISTTSTSTALEAKIYLRGATLASFTVDGKEYLGTRGDAKFDGSKKNVSGGIPICFPQFGPGDELGRDIVPQKPSDIPVHGFARNMDWKLVHDDNDEIDNDNESSSECVLELVDTEDSRLVWPHKFCCRCRIQLIPATNSIAWSLTVKNTSTNATNDTLGTPFQFTCGVHSYFYTEDIDQTIIRSTCFDGSNTNNCIKMNRKVDPPAPENYESDTIRITEFTDDIYKDVFPATITLSSLSPSSSSSSSSSVLHIVNDGGWQDLVVWNPYGNDTLGYKSFVCVESVTTKTVTLGSGETWSASISLVPERVV